MAHRSESENSKPKSHHLHITGTHYNAALKESLSSDPLLSPELHGGPFAANLPSRKYEGDYEGERVKLHPDERGTSSPNGKLDSTAASEFIPRMQADFLEAHKVGVLAKESDDVTHIDKATELGTKKVAINVPKAEAEKNGRHISTGEQLDSSDKPSDNKPLTLGARFKQAMLGNWLGRKTTSHS